MQLRLMHNTKFTSHGRIAENFKNGKLPLLVLLNYIKIQGPYVTCHSVKVWSSLPHGNGRETDSNIDPIACYINLPCCRGNLLAEAQQYSFSSRVMHSTKIAVDFSLSFNHMCKVKWVYRFRGIGNVPATGGDEITSILCYPDENQNYIPKQNELLTRYVKWESDQCATLHFTS